MSKAKVRFILLLAIVLVAIGVVGICAEQATNEPKITIRQLGSQTVLYSIYRGDYSKVGPAIGKLYALAGKSGIYPRGSLSCVYLNSPRYVSSEHCLTEIRIPVGEEALKLAGTLGEMTDVKTMPAMEVAVVEKSMGETDYAAIFNRLYTWIAKQGYLATDDACETFLTNNERNYALMKSEIMIPVKKLSVSKD